MKTFPPRALSTALSQSFGNTWVDADVHPGEAAEPSRADVRDALDAVHFAAPALDGSDVLLRQRAIHQAVHGTREERSAERDEVHLLERGDDAVEHVEADQRRPDAAMQVSSTGHEDLHALVMFVVDANRPFSSPATLP